MSIEGLKYRIVGLAKSFLPTPVADGEYAEILTTLEGLLRLAYEDLAQNALRVGEVDPISEHQDPWTLLDMTGVASGEDEYVYFSMKGAKHFGIQTRKTAGTDVITWTIETTIQADDIPSACTYDDMTEAILNGVATSWTDDGQVWCSVVAPVDGVRLRYRTVGGAGGTDLSAYVKVLY